MRLISEFFKVEQKLIQENKSLVSNELWNYLRIFVGEQFVLNNKPGRSNAKNVVKKGFKSFFYGFKYLFYSYEYIAFIASNQRKEINTKMIHPLDLLPEKYLSKTLFIELPILDHIKTKELKHKKVISRYFFLFFELFLIMVQKPFSIKNDTKLKKINDEFKTRINLSSLSIRFNSNYYVGKLIFKIWKPKAIFCMVPYSFPGYIKAAKEKEIKVLELQHGYAGSKHRAYVNNSGFYGQVYTDYFLSWGQKEKQELSSNKCNYINMDSIFPIGHFYLDALKKRSLSIRKECRNNNYLKYQGQIIAITLIDPLEDVILPFIQKVALRNTKFGFLLLPRIKPHSYYEELNLPKNIFTIDSINTYEGIVLSDIHTTIWSSTAFESVFLGKTNILINHDNLAFDAYGSDLNIGNNVYYSNTVEEYCNYLKVLDFKVNIPKKSNFFESNFEENLNSALDSIFNQD